MLSLLLIFMCVAEARCGRSGTGINRLFACSFANLKNGFYLALVGADTNRYTCADILIKSYNQLVLLLHDIPEIPHSGLKIWLILYRQGALILHIGVIVC